jgi:hypothetical protein
MSSTDGSGDLGALLVTIVKDKKVVIPKKIEKEQEAPLKSEQAAAESEDEKTDETEKDATQEEAALPDVSQTRDKDDSSPNPVKE